MEELTPPNVIFNLGGDFDLDPCAASGHNTAINSYYKKDDGLNKRWFGRVWLHPPKNKTGEFLEKLKDHGNGIALIQAKTKEKWFQELVLNDADAVLFKKGNMTLTREDNSSVSPGISYAFVAYGFRNVIALQNAHRLGAIKGRLIIL